MSAPTVEGLPAWLRQWRHTNRWTQNGWPRRSATRCPTWPRSSGEGGGRRSASWKPSTASAPSTTRWSVAITATNLGWIAEMENELGEARDWYEESRQIRQGIGDAYACAKSTADLGRIARRRKESGVAAELLEDAVDLVAGGTWPPAYRRWTAAPVPADALPATASSF